MGRKGWGKEIAKAQLEPTVKLGGNLLRRIPFGSEVPAWGGSKCHDCEVKVGQLHVPGCDVERCPRCSGQLISCECT